MLMNKVRSTVGWLSLMLSVVWFTACSTIPTTKPSSEVQRLWTARQPALSELQAWNISGRLGIQTQREGWHISFRWQQDDGLYHIVLSDPLGQASAELQGRARSVTLLMADGHSVTAPDPDQLLAKNLGWPVPIKGLHYWVRGLPMPGVKEQHGLDQEGRLKWLKQSGWDISFRRYGDFVGQDLPTKIFLDNDRLKVRLVIDGWT